jgi:hypothetical protein
MQRPLVVALLVSAAALSASLALAAPTLQKVTPRGLHAGGTTTLVLEGDGLSPDAQLLMRGVPFAKQTIKPGATAKRAEIEVTLDGAAPVGIHLLRLAGKDGISNAQAMVVSDIPQTSFAPQISELPAALSGNIVGSTLLSTTFKGQEGQHVVIDVVSRRLGSGIDPAVHVYDTRGTQLAWSPGIRSLAGDPRCELVLPASGEYRIELHDALYRGTEPSQLVLCVGDFHYADFAFPLAVQRGSATSVELVRTNLTPDHAHGQMTGASPGAFELLPWPAGAMHLTGVRPAVLISSYPELVDTASDASLGAPLELRAAPVAVSGRLLKSAEVDAFKVPVTPGQKLHIEVQADMLGSPVDGVLTVDKEAGGQLATNDDRPGTKDPGLDVVIPGGVTAIVIRLRDLYGAGGPDHVYRLSIVPADQPEFTLTVPEDHWQIPSGGTALVRIKAKRKNYGGPIKLIAADFPGELQLNPAEIPAGADQALISLTASSSAVPSAGVFLLRGEAMAKEAPLSRPVQLETTSGLKEQPWLQEELAAAVVTPGPLAVAWTPSADAALIQGTTLPVEMQVTRAAGTTGPVRVALVSSQIAPTKTTKVKNVDQTTEVVERTLRLASEVLLKADQSTTTVPLIVPGDLAAIDYDLALRAELLSADAKTVLASAVTPVRRLATVIPFKLQLTGKPQVDAPAGVGPLGKLTGKLTRVAGFQGMVKVTLDGLPKDVPAPIAVVPPSATDFELAVAFPFGTAVGDLKGVKLVALAVADAKFAQLETRSGEIPVAVKVVKGEKPVVEKPLVIFEDEPGFVASLVEGHGEATLWQEEKYSGTASVKVTPDQRYNPGLPAVGIKIRQYPGPGEFRYVQFAWKKFGGDIVCLQICHDGKLGPEEGQPASFRYHAGPGPQCQGASVLIDEKIPKDFTLVTRDLFADFGEFTLTGIGLSPSDGTYALYDHIQLAKSIAEFGAMKP